MNKVEIYSNLEGALYVCEEVEGTLEAMHGTLEALEERLQGIQSNLNLLIDELRKDKDVISFLEAREARLQVIQSIDDDDIPF